MSVDKIKELSSIVMYLTFSEMNLFHGLLKMPDSSGVYPKFRP